MAVAVLPVAAFTAAVLLGADQADETVRTVARDATAGITVAQDIKLNLAELDQLVVQDLLDPVALGPNGFPADYDAKRAELHDNLVLAAFQASSGAAYRQPLANIEYALGHYHTLVKESFAADARGDRVAATDLYQRASSVMQGTLLSEADFVDKANTYVLNDAYARQSDRSAATGRLIAVTWLVLIGFLVVGQLALARKFRRVVNPALLAATVLTVGVGGYSLRQLDAGADHLTAAREQAFDSVHVLARARATVVSARQAQGHLLLDPGRGAAAQQNFDTYTGHLFRVQESTLAAVLAQVRQGGDVPEGSGGLLAQAATGGSDGRDELARRTIVGFAAFLAADTDMRERLTAGEPAVAVNQYRRGETFGQLTAAIDEAQAEDQSIFDAHADLALDAVARLDRIAAVAAAGVLLLVVLGLWLRLREYGA
jgi:hypothetical protein